jgi:hypothetical protein
MAINIIELHHHAVRCGQTQIGPSRFTVTFWVLVQIRDGQTSQLCQGIG